MGSKIYCNWKTFDVIILPTYTQVAPLHGKALRRPFDFLFTAVFNLVGFPVTQVPVGFDHQGLPIGIQVVAKRGKDHLTLAVAEAIEQEFGGWQASLR